MISEARQPSAVSLRGKCALVTGAGRRVGRAIALRLGREGMRVAVHYFESREQAERTCQEIVSFGGEAASFAADLHERGQARELVARVLEHFGGLNVLVPSAANFERREYAALDDGVWDRALALNLTAPFVLAQAASPSLRTARGSIVFITCASTASPFRNYLPYVVAKGGLQHLMRTLALELAPDVRVNAVAPGTVLPPDTMSSALVDRLAERTPLARIGTPEDIAEAVVYLASAEFVTGHELRVDGGRSLSRTERHT